MKRQATKFLNNLARYCCLWVESKKTLMRRSTLRRTESRECVVLEGSTVGIYYTPLTRNRSAHYHHKLERYVYHMLYFAHQDSRVYSGDITLTKPIMNRFLARHTKE